MSHTQPHTRDLFFHTILFTYQLHPNLLVHTSADVVRSLTCLHCQRVVCLPINACAHTYCFACVFRGNLTACSVCGVSFTPFMHRYIRAAELLKAKLFHVIDRVLFNQSTMERVMQQLVRCPNSLAVNGTSQPNADVANSAVPPSPAISVNGSVTGMSALALAAKATPPPTHSNRTTQAAAATVPDTCSVMPLAELAKHLEACRFGVVTCKAVGCDQQYRRCDKYEHRARCTGLYRCEVCQSLFPVREYVKHVNNVNECASLWRCPTCDKRYLVTASMREHMTGDIVACRPKRCSARIAGQQQQAAARQASSTAAAAAVQRNEQQATEAATATTSRSTQHNNAQQSLTTATRTSQNQQHTTARQVQDSTTPAAAQGTQHIVKSRKAAAKTVQPAQKTSQQAKQPATSAKRQTAPHKSQQQSMRQQQLPQSSQKPAAKTQTATSRSAQHKSTSKAERPLPTISTPTKRKQAASGGANQQQPAIKKARTSSVNNSNEHYHRRSEALPEWQASVRCTRLRHLQHVYCAYHSVLTMLVMTLLAL